MSKKIKDLGLKLMEYAENPELQLIAKVSQISSQDLRKIFPSGDLIVCDFPLVDFNQGCEFITGVAKQYGILNVDHHLPFDCMQRFISSGNLAAEYLRAGNPSAATGQAVIINHTDCDSIISALLMQGVIPPLEIFDQAVIAADHTGAIDEIADLLQALDPLMDLKKSIRNLGLLLAGQQLDSECQHLLDLRRINRQRVACIIEKNAYEVRGPLAVVEITGERIGGELLLPYFSNVVVLATIKELPNAKIEVRLRLCAAAPVGFSLHQVAITDFDAGYGGRWNAGSNRRSEGSSLSKNEYLHLLGQALEQALEQHNRTAAY